MPRQRSSHGLRPLRRSAVRRVDPAAVLRGAEGRRALPGAQHRAADLPPLLRLGAEGCLQTRRRDSRRPPAQFCVDGFRRRTRLEVRKNHRKTAVGPVRHRVPTVRAPRRLRPHGGRTPGDRRHVRPHLRRLLDEGSRLSIFLSAAASASALFPPFARLDEDQFTVMFVDNLIRVLDEVGLPLTPMDLSHYVEEQLPATHYLRQFVIDFSNEGNVQQLWEAQQSYCTAVILEYLSCSADWIIETSMQAGSAVYRMAHKDADACTQLDEEEFADELMSGSVNELLRKAGVDLQIQVVRQLTFLDPDIEQPGPPVDRPPGNEYDPLSTTAPYVLLGCILAIAAAFAATRACRSSCVAQKKEKEPELQCRSEPDQPQPPDAYYPEEEVDEVVHHTVRLVRRTFAKNKDEQNDRKEVINAEVLQLLKALGISTMSHNPLNPS
ncbi:hypothetical protein DIPPA_08768 [Diplonema papillatum]|nr:hypothetical protein DIPPA_08768 [Diplonema papillatum]